MTIIFSSFCLQHYLDPPKELSATLDRKGIPQTEFHTIKHGETKVITSEVTKQAQARHSAVVFESSH